MPRSLKVFSFFLGLLLASIPIPAEKKVGLVLSGGGAKGLAHIPTLKLLDELDFPVDYITGTSVGGVIGALYALGYSGAEIEELSRAIAWEELFTDTPPRAMLPFFHKRQSGKYQLDFSLEKGIPRVPQALIYGEKISLLFSRLTAARAGIADFDHLPIPFRCVAVDLISGEEVVLGGGSLSKAMRSTMAIPTIFSPVEWEEYLLVDGALLNNLPVDVVKTMGAEVVIAVDLGSPLYEEAALDTADKILQQSLLVVETNQKKEQRKLADIVIQPDMQDLGAMDFFSPDKLRRIRESGEKAALESREALISFKMKHRLPDRIRRQDSLTPAAGLGPGEALIIERIAFSGLEQLSASFMRSRLRYRPGDMLDLVDLNHRIMELYGLGYFKSIRYDIERLGDGKIALLLEIQELPRGKLRLGLRYDNLHEVVAVGGLHYSNVLIPGLRLENEIQFVGLTRFDLRLYYPSRALSLPVYPLMRFSYKRIPTRIFDGEGNRIANYNDQSWKLGGGLGLLLKKWLNLEICLQQELVSIKPKVAFPDPVLFPTWKERLRQICATLTLDTLDDVLLPETGIRLKARFENSSKALGTETPYRLFDTSLDLYVTPVRGHTLRFYGYWGESSTALPAYKFFNQGHPHRFVGMRFDQLFGSSFKLVRCDYRVKLANIFYVKAMGNAAFDLEQDYSWGGYRAEKLWGVGAGLQLDTALGPVEMIYSLGSKNLVDPNRTQGVFYAILGTRF